MLTQQDEIPARPYAGLYLGTRQQKRFWGWTNRGWGALRNTRTKHPPKDLAAWLRLAHAGLDGDKTPPPASPETISTAASVQDAREEQTPQPSRRNPRLQFVCNRHMIGLLFR